MTEPRHRLILDGRYLLNENGEIYSLYFRNGQAFYKRKTPLLMKQSNVLGYKSVVLMGKSYRVHRLLAEAFIEGFKKEHQINHKDGVKSNNVISNLELSNNSHNQLHSYHVLGNTNLKKVSKKDLKLILKMWKNGNGVTKICKSTNISYSAVYSLLKNRLLNPESALFGDQYLDVLIGFAKSRHSKHRLRAREAMKKIRGE